MDYKAFSGLTRFALVSFTSMTVFAFMCGTLGYSWWWQWQMEKARREGRDLDQWFEEFDSSKDPVSRKFREWGWSPDYRKDN